MKGLTSALIVLAAFASAQEEKRTDKELRKQAFSLLRQLELPARHYAAAGELVAIGDVAVPVLMTGLGDPRPEVVARYLDVLRWIPVKDPAVLGVIEGLVASSSPIVAHAALDCLTSQRHAGKNLCIDFSKNTANWWTTDAKDKASFQSFHNFGRSPYDGEIGPDGNLVVTTGSKLRVTPPGGADAWSGDVSNAIDVDLLPGDRYLVADRKSHHCAVMDRDGNTVWRYHVKGMLAVESGRQRDGTTLVCDHRNEANGGGVHVVDAAGKLVRKVKCTEPCDAETLIDGSIVVMLSDTKSWRIYAPDGTVRTDCKLPMKPSDVDVLPDGTLLIAGGTKILRYTQEGKLIGETNALTYICGVQLMAGGPMPAPVDPAAGDK